jgi:hypothetical protein
MKVTENILLFRRVIRKNTSIQEANNAFLLLEQGFKFPVSIPQYSIKNPIMLPTIDMILIRWCGKQLDKLMVFLRKEHFEADGIRIPRLLANLHTKYKLTNKQITKIIDMIHMFELWKPEYNNMILHTDHMVSNDILNKLAKYKLIDLNKEYVIHVIKTDSIKPLYIEYKYLKKAKPRICVDDDIIKACQESTNTPIDYIKNRSGKLTIDDIIIMCKLPKSDTKNVVDKIDKAIHENNIQITNECINNVIGECNTKILQMFVEKHGIKITKEQLREYISKKGLKSLLFAIDATTSLC